MESKFPLFFNFRNGKSSKKGKLLQNKGTQNKGTRKILKLTIPKITSYDKSNDFTWSKKIYKRPLLRKSLNKKLLKWVDVSSL